MVVQRNLLPGDPPWLETAFAEIGTQEKNPGDSARIVEYHAHTSLGATSDETPWCSSYCCFVMDKHQITSTNSAASLSWMRWGRVIEQPERGCLVILERVDNEGVPIPRRGHCGFWLGETNGEVVVLGGNQSNRVSIETFPAARVIGYRWPAMAINSTTNRASLIAGVGTVATAVPAVTNLVSSAETVTEQVLSLGERFGLVVEKITAAPDNLFSVAGLLITFAALWYIVKERNKKIKRLGV